jgi:uncharacterized protein
MEILPNIEIIDLGLYFVKHKMLVVTDTQFGYEEHLNRQGVFVPRFVHKEMLGRMEAILKACCKRSQVKQLNTVLVNGDLKHEFGRISETEWRHCVRFLKLLGKYAERIILVKGNHDTMLEPIAKTRGLKVVDHYFVEDECAGGVLFIHGDSVPDIVYDKKVNTIIIGHEHPAVAVTQWPRIEKYKAFLVGKWSAGLLKRSKKLIVLPSFNTATHGTDIMKERLLSPFLRGQKMMTFEAYLVGDEVYHFGKLENLTKIKKK